MTHGGQGSFSLARLLTLGRGVVCISEKSRDTADCLLYSETQKDPRNPRVGLAGRSYPESGAGSRLPACKARRNEWNLQMLDMTRCQAFSSSGSVHSIA